jgi:hypothetical protein
MYQGWKLYGDKQVMTLKKGNQMLRAESIPTPTGMLYAMRIERRNMGNASCTSHTSRNAMCSRVDRNRAVEKDDDSIVSEDVMFAVNNVVENENGVVEAQEQLVNVVDNDSDDSEGSDNINKDEGDGVQVILTNSGREVKPPR